MSIKPQLFLLLTIIILATSVLLSSIKTSTLTRPLKQLFQHKKQLQFVRPTSTMTTSPSLKFDVRKSHERGKADHGWLKTFHTFSFADYYSIKYSEYGPLRVINEDRVAPETGFPTHQVRSPSPCPRFLRRKFVN